VRGKTSQRTLCSRRRHRPLILRVRKEESSRACARQKTMPKNTKIKIYNIAISRMFFLAETSNPMLLNNNSNISENARFY
jgi:hypothetical protein